MTQAPLQVRDYSADMNDFINARLDRTDSAPTLAKTIIQELLDEDPDLLEGWLALHTMELIRKAIGDRNRQTRQRNRTRAMQELVTRAKLQVASAQVAAGNLVPATELSNEILKAKSTAFLAERYHDDDGRMVTLGQMNHAQRLKVASYHKTMGEAHLVRHAFMIAIDNRCGGKKTADVYTEAELSALWRKLNGIKESD